MNEEIAARLDDEARTILANPHKPIPFIPWRGPMPMKREEMAAALAVAAIYIRDQGGKP